jgi:hypothetical protein
MIGGNLYAGAAALIFAACAAHGIRTGRLKIWKFSPDPYLRRREQPVAFWTYATLLAATALLFTCVAIFVA